MKSPILLAAAFSAMYPFPDFAPIRHTTHGIPNPRRVKPHGWKGGAK